MKVHDAPAAVERVGWADFLAHRFRWEQGEHVALVGPTGTGKTVLAAELLPLRRFVAVFGTKARDTSLDHLARTGYKRIERWPPAGARERVLLWPKVRGAGDVWGKQYPAFRDGLTGIFATGGWCVHLDELRYITDTLKLAREVELLWLQGRSLHVSIIAATQRPAMVPLTMYDQSTHLFFWRDNDERNLKRLSGIGWLAAGQIRETVARLGRHEVLYINTRTGVMLVTKAERTPA